MTITRSATFLAGLLAMLSLPSFAAHAAMNDSGLPARTGYARPSPIPARLGLPAEFPLPASLTALGLDLSPPETVAAIPSEPLAGGTSGIDPADEVIGANN